MTIGFIGQGWIGKHYADDVEARGYTVVRYAREEPYAQNREQIAQCDLVFVAVPTPTTKEGFDDSIVHEVLSLIGEGKCAVIKSTLRPGTTESLQDVYPHIFVLHSPEFLREANAAHDAANPARNIIGMPRDTAGHRKYAERVLSVLPRAPYARVMTAREAELVKYAGNAFLYTKVVFMNLLYDLVAEQGASWEAVHEAMIHDVRIGESHTEPVHASGHSDGNASGHPNVGRGAGGHCFIKDFEVFRRMYDDALNDPLGSAALGALKDKNNELLRASGKDLDVLAGVYGE